MNSSHRSLWNSVLGAWVAVSEITRGRGKRSGVSIALAGGSVLALGMLLGSTPALAGGDGGYGARYVDVNQPGGAEIGLGIGSRGVGNPEWAGNGRAGAGRT